MNQNLVSLKKEENKLIEKLVSLREQDLKNHDLLQSIWPDILNLGKMIFITAYRINNSKDYDYLLNIAEKWNNFISYHGGVAFLIKLPKPIKKKTLCGKVIKKSGEKTVKVEVNRHVKHPKYKKYQNKKNSFLAHDSQNKCSVGDEVLISPTSPISKRKKHRVVKILTDTPLGDFSGKISVEPIHSEQFHRQMEMAL